MALTSKLQNNKHNIIQEYHQYLQIELDILPWQRGETRQARGSQPSISKISAAVRVSNAGSSNLIHFASESDGLKIKLGRAARRDLGEI